MDQSFTVPQITTLSPNGLNLGPLTELCIVTPSHRATLSSLSSHLGIGPFRIHHFNGRTLSQRSFRGRPSDFTLVVCFAELCPGVVLEVMEPTGEAPSLMSEWLERRRRNGSDGEGIAGAGAGVQHVAFELGGGGMEERIKGMRERGFEVVMRGVWEGKERDEGEGKGKGKGECRFAFFDTEEKGCGVCVETIEFTEGWVEPEPVEWFPGPPGPLAEEKERKKGTSERSGAEDR